MNKSRIEEHKHELPNGVPVEPAAPPPEVIEQRRETMRHGILADMVACRKASPRRAPPSSIPDGGPVGLMCAELSKQAHGFACVMPGSASFCQSVMVVSYLAHQRAKVAAEALWELNREAY